MFERTESSSQNQVVRDQNAWSHRSLYLIFSSTDRHSILYFLSWIFSLLLKLLFIWFTSYDFYLGIRILRDLIYVDYVNKTCLI